MKILFINACVRKESRTLVLAKDVLSRLEGEVTRLDLEEEELMPLNRDSLAKREDLLKAGEREDPMLRYARQFAEADKILIAAPFWDLSFPSLLKIYLEQISVAGITFEYRNGRPAGLCRAESLIYVTTAGGEIFQDFGYTYVKSLAKDFYGIKDTVSYRATNLDVRGISAEDLLREATITEVK